MHKSDKALGYATGDKIMVKIFSKDYLINTLGLPADSEYVISDRVIDNDRWTIDHELLFSDPADGKVYRAYYRTGATELQDEAPWEYDNTVPAEEMELQAIVKKEYMPVGEPIYENDEFLQYLADAALDGAIGGTLTLFDVRQALQHFTDEEAHTQTFMQEAQEVPPMPESAASAPSDASRAQETDTRTFTNFFDCNGKRIYVGDYVEDQVTGHIGTVGWDEAHASYRLMEYDGSYIDNADTDWRVLDDPTQAQEMIVQKTQAFQKFFEKFKKKMDDVFYLDSETTLLRVGMRPSFNDTFTVNCPDGADLSYRLGDLFDQYMHNREAGNAHPLKDIVNSIEDAYDTHDIEEENDEEEEYEYED